MTLTLAVVLAFVACDDGSGNSGSGSGGGNGGNGGGGGVVPAALRGTWTSGSWSYTFTEDTMVLGYDYKSNSEPGRWRIFTYEVTSCLSQTNYTAATKKEFPRGYRLSLKATKIEFGDYFSADEVPAVGSTRAEEFFLNAEKSKMTVNAGIMTYLILSLTPSTLTATPSPLAEIPTPLTATASSHTVTPSSHTATSSSLA